METKELSNVIAELELLKMKVELERVKAKNLDDKIDLYNAAKFIQQAMDSIKETF